MLGIRLMIIKKSKKQHSFQSEGNNRPTNKNKKQNRLNIPTVTQCEHLGQKKNLHPTS